MLAFLRNKGTDPKAQLRKVLGEFELPAFPAIAQEVLALMRDDDVPGAKIADGLGRDPGLSVSVLRTVNPLLVLNILGRSRAKLLLPNVPVSLEPQFLARDVISTDPRLIQMVREDACAQEQ